MMTIQTKKSLWCLDVVSLNNTVIVVLQDNAIFLHLESLEEKRSFHNLNYLLKRKQDIYLWF